MKRDIVRKLVAILVMTLFNVVFQLLSLPVIGGATYILMLLFDILLYWHADKRYYGFIHSTLMSGAVIGLVWLGIWDFQILFRNYHPALKEILEMFLVAVIAGGLWFLGMYYLGLQKDGES